MSEKNNSKSSTNRWSIESAEDDAVWTTEYVKSVVKAPCMPAKVQRIGSVEVSWEELDPGVASVRAKGGSLEDRYLAEQIILSKLQGNGYERAYFSFDPEHKTGSWDDIMAKAQRLIKSGQVQLLRNGYNNVVAQVKGDHGTYISEIGRDDPTSRAITTWQCECPWDDYAWGRTRQWKKYEGRPCAHVLATFWQAQSAPLDEELEQGQVLPPGQRGFQPKTPADIPGIGIQQRLPFQESPEQAVPAMPPPGDPQPVPGAQPAAPDILPPFPGEQLQLVPPGQLAPGQPGITVSEPGARQPTPFNPMQNPSTYSKVEEPWVFEAVDFNNSDMVRLEEDEYGIAEGKSEEHGAGEYKLIPKGSIGEVLGQDPHFKWVDVIFAGPQENAGPMEPYHIRALVEPNMLTPMPNVKKPGPAVRRR